MNEKLIKDAINNLINRSKKILIPNAIATLTANLSKACEYDDFYKIDYEAFAKKIIDDSNLPPSRKEEIRQRFKNPPIAEPIKIKTDFFSDPGKKEPEEKRVSIKAQAKSSNIVATNVAHFDDLIANPPVFHKTRFCLGCNKPIEEDDLTFYSGYPYHSFCIKCDKCSSSDNESTPKTINNYICITQGMFLCNKHYQEYFSSKKITSDVQHVR